MVSVTVLGVVSVIVSVTVLTLGEPDPFASVIVSVTVLTLGAVPDPFTSVIVSVTVPLAVSVMVQIPLESPDTVICPYTVSVTVPGDSLDSVT